MLQNLKKNWYAVSKMARIWWNLTWAMEILKISFDLLLLCKVYNVWPKKSTEELSFMTLKSDAKFEEKLTCGSENDMKNLENFHRTTPKSQNRHFDGILLSKVENVWASNLQGSYVSWQWRMMQNLKRNWLVISKLTWGI